MPGQHPPHFPRDMASRMLVGEGVVFLVLQTVVLGQTLHRWKRLALVRQGVVDSANSAESAQWRAPKKRITTRKKDLSE